MDMKNLSESDICAKFITPALVAAGWDETVQIRREVTFTDGRIVVRGKMVSRGKGKRADYVLSHTTNLPLAVIEAKDANHAVGDGLQQAMGYAKSLQVPFVFSSNGKGFRFLDRTCVTGGRETDLRLDEFPSPQELWERYCVWKGVAPEKRKVLEQPWHDGKSPRYYQVNAVNAALEAVSRGQDRVLLVMATGTGKTYTAFQILWRLWKAGAKKRILFLADRNILVDQTMVNDFRPFAGAMAKLSTNAKTIEKADGTKVELTLAMESRTSINKAYEVYLGLYQALTGPEEKDKVFREFSRDFFDLIVIDECHRGSAAEDSAWREILDWFSGATQIGLTATPKETEYVSNIAYFGDPVYTYSLKEGIRDGFLAPYKVVKVHIDRDVDGWRPEKGTVDRSGEIVDDRIYNQRDFDQNLVIDGRTAAVARKVSRFLKESGDRMAKTIVFCVDQEHADRMRKALVNENADLCAANDKYVMRITGGDAEGKDQLDNFIDPESKYPVIVTTSRLLSTGVDAQTCRMIALDRPVGSMTEFKQIVGRGTRIHKDTHKLYFTLMDFRGATAHFADPEFDGEPVQILSMDDEGWLEDESLQAADPGPDGADADPEDPDATVLLDSEGNPVESDKAGKKGKVYVDGIEARIVHERVEFLDEDGKLVTESLRDFTRKSLRKRYASLDQFLKAWSHAERKQAILDELAEEGLTHEVLAEAAGVDLDPFDLVCHVAFDRAPLTRAERAANVRKRDVFGRYEEAARKVLEALLAKYADEGVLDLEDPQILSIAPFTSMGTPVQLIKAFGSRDAFEHAVHELQSALYTEAA
ncbi:MAG: DEAD/DEAH box helicase family protein [Fibrobacteria bacterium]|nr:DEAD/DEAH box helicase family protein [Fibrobacteria bacterium]